MTNLWVVEWSKRQCAIHVQLLEYSLENARERFLRNEGPPNDYEALFVGKRDEADAFANVIRATVHMRSEIKREDVNN